MKVCGTCREPLSDENANRVFTGKQAGEFQSYCRGCQKEYQKAWQKRNPEACKAASYRWAAKPENKLKMKIADQERKRQFPEKRRGVERQSKLRRKYGISLGQFQALLDAQNGVCKICNQNIVGKTSGRKPKAKAHVDHHHGTGKIRGLLCSPCNLALGLFGELPSRLRAAAGYLESK